MSGKKRPCHDSDDEPSEQLLCGEGKAKQTRKKKRRTGDSDDEDWTPESDQHGGQRSESENDSEDDGSDEKEEEEGNDAIEMEDDETNSDGEVEYQLAELKRARSDAEPMTQLTQRLNLSPSDVRELMGVASKSSASTKELSKLRDRAMAVAMARMASQHSSVVPALYWCKIRGRLISRFAGYADIVFAFLTAVAKDCTSKMLCVPADLPVPELYLLERQVLLSDTVADLRTKHACEAMFVVRGQANTTNLAKRLMPLVTAARAGGYRFVVVDITLQARNARGTPVDVPHANLALLEVDTHTVYYFEPHGAVAFLPREASDADILHERWRLLGEAVCHSLADVLGKRPEDLNVQVKECRSEYYQKLVFISKQGKCAVWCALFLHSILHSGQHPEKMEKDFDALDPDSCAVIIQGYTSFLYNYLVLHPVARNAYFRLMGDGHVRYWLPGFPSALLAQAKKPKKVSAPTSTDAWQFGPIGHRRRKQEVVYVSIDFGRVRNTAALAAGASEYFTGVVSGWFLSKAPLNQAVKALIKVNATHFPDVCYLGDAPDAHVKCGDVQGKEEKKQGEQKQKHAVLLLQNKFDISSYAELFALPLSAFDTSPEHRGSKKRHLLLARRFALPLSKSVAATTTVLRLGSRFWHAESKPPKSASVVPQRKTFRYTQLKLPLRGSGTAMPLVKTQSEIRQQTPLLVLLGEGEAPLPIADTDTWDVVLVRVLSRASQQPIATRHRIRVSFQPTPVPASLVLTLDTFPDAVWRFSPADAIPPSPGDRHRLLSAACDGKVLSKKEAKQALVWAQDLPLSTARKPLVIQTSAGDHVDLLCRAVMFQMVVSHMLRMRMRQASAAERKEAKGRLMPVVMLTGSGVPREPSVLEGLSRTRLMRHVHNDMQPDQLPLDLVELSQKVPSLAKLIIAWKELAALMVHDGEVQTLCHYLQQQIQVFSRVRGVNVPFVRIHIDSGKAPKSSSKNLIAYLHIAVQGVAVAEEPLDE